MEKLKDIQENVTPLVKELVEDSTNKLEAFFKSMAEGFEKFFTS